VIGYEVACRLGRSVQPGTLHRRGFHPTSVFGTVAAAASAAAAMGLDGESTGRAIALAATRAAGLVHFGSKAWTKALQAGWAAAAGCEAAALASRGFEAPAGILEERGGLLFAVAGADGFDPSPLGRPDSCWAISEVSYKPYAHSTDLHSAVDAVLDVCRTSGLTASEIASVEVGLTKGVFDATAGGDRERHQPVTVRAAQQSVYFVVAVALGAYRPDVGVQTFHEWFTESRLGDPTVLDLATRVTATVDPTLDEVRPHASPASVIIKARDGRRLAERVADHRGAPGRPFDREDLKKRLRHFTSEAERAILAIEALPGASSIEGVGSLLRQAPDVH
jgi:2-methylcitrate dehydratase PrpD